MTRCLFWVLSCLTILSGCASSSVILRPHSTDDTAWSSTAVLLSYDLNTDDDSVLSEGCTLVLFNKDEQKDYEMKLPGRNHSVLFDIPTGNYSGKTLKCPGFREWDLSEFLKGSFSIQVSRINYLGKVVFAFAPANSGMTVRLGDQTAATDSLNETMGRLPQSWKMALFNPFTVKPITADMLTSGKSQHRMQIKTTFFLKTNQTKISTTDLEEALTRCDADEQHHFPYRLGWFAYTATYENQLLTDLQKEDHDSFSDTFTSCIATALKIFKPTTNVKFQVSVTL
jgi:hypothetical protein